MPRTAPGPALVGWLFAAVHPPPADRDCHDRPAGPGQLEHRRRSAHDTRGIGVGVEDVAVVEAAISRMCLLNRCRCRKYVAARNRFPSGEEILGLSVIPRLSEMPFTASQQAVMPSQRLWS